jgi:xanthine dehydrogenase/oxidase
VQSSKGIGEPPLFLGSTVFFALREAVRHARTIYKPGAGEENEEKILSLDSPATAERLRLAIGDDLVRRTKVVKNQGDRPFFVGVS